MQAQFLHLIRLVVEVGVLSFCVAGCGVSMTPIDPVPATPSTPAMIASRTPAPTWAASATRPIEKTVLPTPSWNLPEEAFIDGFTAHGQLLPLDCEARTAVDWAAYFGHTILEYEFFTRLPRSTNPNEGFVGDVRGEWGGLPPGDYGIHAAPVAALLRQYGVNAQDREGMRWEELAAEIAAGRPVMVWVTGHTQPGKGVIYTVPGGEEVLVAAREHTVVATGYNPDSVTIRDGNQSYTRSREQFMQSWAALGFMAIVYSPM